MDELDTASRGEVLRLIQHAFSLFDNDKNGSIDAGEFASVLRFLGQDPSQEDVEQRLREIDENGNGLVDFNEFIFLIENLAEEENDSGFNFLETLITKAHMRSVLEKVPILSGCDDKLIDQLVARLVPHTFGPNTYLMKQGDDGTEMWIISSGQVDILVGPTELCVATLGKGAFIGEVALLKSAKRNASVRTVNECHVSRLDKSDFDEVMSAFPETRQLIMQVADGRDRARDVIQKVDIFRDCEGAFLNQLVVKLKPEFYKPTDVIIQEGDTGREMFILDKGEVEVVAGDYEGSGGIKVLAKLPAGTFFGEIALLKNTRRNASIRCLTECEVFRLNQNDFEEVLDKFPDYTDKIQAVAAEKTLRREQHMMPLHLACRSGIISEVDDVLSKGDLEQLINQKDELGWTCVHETANAGHGALLKHLHSRGADTDIANHEGVTPLVLAASAGHLESVRVLLELGARPDSQNDDGETALHFAARNGSEDICNLLIEKKAKVNVQSVTGWTPLHYCSNLGYHSIMKAIIDNGANVNLKAENDETSALHQATLSQDMEAVKVLLDAGAEVDAPDNEGGTPLQYAANSGSTDACRLLLDRGADPSYQDQNGHTPLHHAAATGTVELVQLLIERGAHPKSRGLDGGTPYTFASGGGFQDCADVVAIEESDLIWAIRLGELEEVRQLLQTGTATPAEYDPDDFWTPLHEAAVQGVPDMIKLLLHYNADVAAVNNTGLTPVHIAAANGMLVAVKIMLNQTDGRGDRCLLMYDKSGRNPLHLSLSRFHLEVSHLILSKTVNYTIPDHAGKSARDYYRENPRSKYPDQGYDFFHPAVGLYLEKEPPSELYFALLSDDPLKTVQELFEKGEDVDMDFMDEKGQSVLHVAVTNGFHDVVAYLLEKGMDPNVKDSSGQSPIFLAAGYGQLNTVQLLLSKGADARIKDANDNTAYDYAVTNGHDDCAALLYDHAGNFLQAVLTGELDLVAHLIPHPDCDPNMTDPESGDHILLYAAKQGYTEIVELLLEHGADPDAIALEGDQNLLHMAVNHGNAALVAALIQSGKFNIDAVDNDGNTALHLAAQLGRNDIIQALLEAGARTDVSNNAGQTPHDVANAEGHADAMSLLMPADQKLSQAVQQGDHDTVSALLESGECDANLRGEYGNSLLHYAAERNDSDLIYLLLAHGAEIDAKNDIEQTPLHVAARKGHSDALSVLLRKRANIHLVDNAGHTALHLGAIEGDIASLELLKMHKANLTALSHAEKTARDLALENGNHKAAQLLQTPDEAIADAIVRGDADALERLIDDGKCNKESWPGGMHPVHFAARRNRPELIKLLVQKGFDYDVLNEDGQSAWHIAAQAGGLEAVMVLADFGADLMSVDNKANSAHHFAAEQGRMNITEYLNSKGCGYTDRNSDSKTPYDLAMANGHEDLASLILPPSLAAFRAIEEGDRHTLISLLQSGKCDPNEVDSNGKPLLHLALRRGDSELISMLLSRGADPNCRDAQGKTALHAAVLLEKGELVGLLLTKGAKPNASDQDGNTPLHDAASIGFIAGIRRLLKSGARRDIKNRSNRLPIDVALEGGFIAAAELLKHPDDAARDAMLNGNYDALIALFDDEQITPGTRNNKGETLLHLAVELGDMQLVHILLDHGVSMNQGDDKGNTAMHLAAASSDRVEILRTFLGTLGKTSVCNHDGDTPLHVAAANNNPDALEGLLAAGAERHARNKQDLTAYDIAFDLGYHDCVDVLTVSHAILMAVMSGDREGALQVLEEGECDANMMNSRGSPLLHLACDRNDLPMVQLLLAHGAKINARDTFHRTCAHVLATRGYSKILKVMMLKGLKVDTSDKDGNTPLHYAGDSGSESIVRKLIGAKVRIGKLNSKGQLAEHLAIERGHLDVAILLARARFQPLNNFESEIHRAVHRFSLVSSEQLFLMANLQQFLRDETINVNKRDGPSQSAVIHIAASVKHPPALSMLLRHRRPNINAKNGNSHTPLHLAAAAGDSESVQTLLFKGADPNIADRNGWTPLHEAAYRGDEESASRLLDGGAITYVENSCGLTPAQLAERQGHLVLARLLSMPPAGSRRVRLQQAVMDHDHEAVQRLVDQGESATVIDENGSSLLHLACLAFKPDRPESTARETVMELVDAGAKLDTVDDMGRSVCHVLCLNRDLKTLYFVLKAGANCDLMDRHGNTPLHIVASTGFKEGAIALLSASHASLGTHNKKGLTPFKLAVKKNHMELAHLLERTLRGDGHIPTPNNLRKAQSVAFLPTPSPHRRPPPGSTTAGFTQGYKTPKKSTTSIPRSKSAIQSTPRNRTQSRVGWATAPVTPQPSRPATRSQSEYGHVGPRPPNTAPGGGGGGGMRKRSPRPVGRNQSWSAAK